MNKRKILYYNSTLLKGGTDVYMLNIIRNINKSKFQVDVIIKDGDRFNQSMLDEIEELGSNVFFAKGTFFSRMKQIKKFFLTHKNEYDLIHINATSGATGLIAYFAKHYGKIQKVIFHSHMGGNDNGKSLVDKFGIWLMKKNTDILAACSMVASDYMFGNKIKKDKVVLLKNAVDYKFFEYNSSNRRKLREKYNINESDFVILHVGRFVEQKNHKKLIEIFSNLLKKEPSSKLILIGEGLLEEKVKEQVQELNIEQSVMFLGVQNNINEFMSMADCLVMPSFHEGLPIVAVEAQASDLPLILSNNISKETKLTEKVEFISLDESLDVWSDNIIAYKSSKRNSNYDLFKTLGFDKEESIKIIEKLYEK